MPVGALVSKSRLMTAESCSRSRSAEKSSARSKLDGRITRPFLLMMNDSMGNLAGRVEQLDRWVVREGGRRRSHIRAAGESCRLGLQLADMHTRRLFVSGARKAGEPEDLALTNRQDSPRAVPADTLSGISAGAASSPGCNRAGACALESTTNRRFQYTSVNLNEACLTCSTFFHACRWMSSFLTVAFHDSAAALPKHIPVCPADGKIRLPRHTSRNARAVLASMPLS